MKKYFESDPSIFLFYLEYYKGYQLNKNGDKNNNTNPFFLFFNKNKKLNLNLIIGEMNYEQNNRS